MQSISDASDIIIDALVRCIASVCSALWSAATRHQGRCPCASAASCCCGFVVLAFDLQPSAFGLRLYALVCLVLTLVYHYLCLCVVFALCFCLSVCALSFVLGFMVLVLLCFVGSKVYGFDFSFSWFMLLFAERSEAWFMVLRF